MAQTRRKRTKRKTKRRTNKKYKGGDILNYIKRITKKKKITNDKSDNESITEYTNLKYKCKNDNVKKDINRNFRTEMDRLKLLGRYNNKSKRQGVYNNSIKKLSICISEQELQERKRNQIQKQEKQEYEEKERERQQEEIKRQREEIERQREEQEIIEREIREQEEQKNYKSAQLNNLYTYSIKINDIYSNIKHIDYNNLKMYISKFRNLHNLIKKQKKLTDRQIEKFNTYVQNVIFVKNNIYKKLNSKQIERLDFSNITYYDNNPNNNNNNNNNDGGG